MKFPNFYDDIVKIKTYDPLSELLGTTLDGINEYSYKDIVKFSGHGCPTVAGAYLMTYLGIEALYSNQLPTRGMVEVHLNNQKDIGTTGVIASVTAFILGAADEGGFKGLSGKYSRNNLIKFSENFDGILKLIKVDSRESVELNYHPQIINFNPKMSLLLNKINQNVHTKEELNEFQNLWNSRLKNILIDEFRNPNLITIKQNRHTNE